MTYNIGAPPRLPIDSQSQPAAGIDARKRLRPHAPARLGSAAAPWLTTGSVSTSHAAGGEGSDADAADAALSDRVALGHQSPLSGVRVLVVDDDADLRALTAAILDAAGALVESAESAASGFEAMLRFRPQLLVSDVGMPEADGYSLVRRIRALAVEDGGAIPCVALTAFATQEHKAQALAAGFTLHLAKPIQPAVLLEALGELAPPEPQSGASQ